MTFSIKKIFTGKDNETKPVQAAETNTEDSTVEEAQDKKKLKHDTPTGCCGSCS